MCRFLPEMLADFLLHASLDLHVYLDLSVLHCLPDFPGLPDLHVGRFETFARFR